MTPSTPDTVHHPFFARLWTVIAAHETETMRESRRANLAGLSGRVLEVGAGTGTNFAFYPDSCLLYTSPSPRDATLSRMPSSA